MGSLHPAPTGRGARVLHLVTDHAFYKVAALFFAVALWIVVSAGETVERMLAARVELVLEPGARLAEPLPPVQVRVSGRARELFKLTAARPVVRRTVGATTADRSPVALRVGDVLLPPGIDASVREVQPRSIVVRLVRDRTGDSVASERP